MKTYLVSVTECINPEADVNMRRKYVVPSETEDDALDQIMQNLTPPMLMDGNGYPHVMEIVRPMCIGGKFLD